VDGRTGLYAVLGEPVDHSRSPEIQNAAFHATGMNAVYVALEVPAARLPQALEGLHAAHVMGLNLTSPHKEAAYALVRERTAEAEEANAVNTLRWEPSGWRGHATDGAGFLSWIRETTIDVSGRGVLVLGAGGAARAIVPRLLDLGPERVHVVSRDPGHARDLGERVGATGKTRLTTAALADSGPFAWDLLVRALATDWISTEEERWWRAHSPHAAVLDLNYGTRAAAARVHAGGFGIRYEDGIPLLVHQGAASFEFWTGQEAPVHAMREALRSV
jgi:shikimate dehydrogenase